MVMNKFVFSIVFKSLLNIFLGLLNSFELLLLLNHVLLDNWTAMAGDHVTQGQGQGQPLFIHYKIQEETMAGHLVGNLKLDSGLGLRYIPNVLNKLHFRFVAENVDNFEIESKTGIIRTTNAIDRDSATVCRQLEICEIHLSVVVQPVDFLRIIRVVIIILDINDNPPKFRDSLFHLSIAEAAATGSSYILPTATDVDSPANGVQRYELDMVGGYMTEVKFGLRTVKKLDGSTEILLELLGKLDREWEEEHRMRLTAYDGGTPSRSGHLDIVIKVLDSNDNKPEFSKDRYQVSVIENAPAGTVILQLQASDRDQGPSGTVSYHFAPQTLTSHGSLFDIRNSSGILFVKDTIDREKTAVFHLAVLAVDHGPDPKTSETTVIVHVEDVNDNPPQIVTSTLSVGESGMLGLGGASEGMAAVSEDSEVGSFVAHISVSDPDEGYNGRVNCSINTNSFTLMQKYSNEYQIVTAMLLDRERQSRYSITIRCQDMGSFPHITETLLNVKVMDVNDNVPVFSMNTYYANLVENNFIGTSLLQVSASDPDENENSRVGYLIPSPSSIGVSFLVDQRGVITVQDSIDREMFESFRFPILAVDHGKPSKTGSALVVIKVVDVNDEKPIFIKDRYEFPVSENQQEVVSVGIVSAVDKDSEPHNVVLYSFLGGHLTTEYFSIDTRSGAIFTRRSLDRELQETHQIVVHAWDEQLDIFSSTTTVLIHVTDVNDNSPVFTFPSHINNTIHISNLQAVDSVIAQVAARDIDSGPNGRVTYDVTFDGDVTSFKVDSYTGDVIVKRSLKGDDQRIFKVAVLAKDNGNPRRSTSEILHIVVNRTIPLNPAALSTDDISFMSTSGPFLYILLAVIIGCCVVAVAMFVAMVLGKRRERNRRHAAKNSRMQDALKSLVPKNDTETQDKLEKLQLNGHCTVDPSIESTALDEMIPWLREDADEQDSLQSGDGTDSGRGPSEEGSSVITNRLRYIPPPPPPSRNAYWSQAQIRASKAALVGCRTLPAGSGSRNKANCVVRFQGLKATPEEGSSEELSEHGILLNDHGSLRERQGGVKSCCNGSAGGGCGNSAGATRTLSNSCEKFDSYNGNFNSRSSEIYNNVALLDRNGAYSVSEKSEKLKSRDDKSCSEAVSRDFVKNLETSRLSEAKKSDVDSAGGECYYISLNKSKDIQALPLTAVPDFRRSPCIRNTEQSFVL